MVKPLKLMPTVYDKEAFLSKTVILFPKGTYSSIFIYMKKGMLFLLLCVFAIVPAWTEVSATYVPESSIYFSVSPGPFTSNTIIGAKIGTLTISTTGGTVYYNPGLVDLSHMGSPTITGLRRSENPISWNADPLVYSYTEATFQFCYILVCYPNGRGAAPVLNPVWSDNKTPIGGDSVAITPNNPFSADIYLVNTNSTVASAAATFYPPASYFKLDTAYKFSNAALRNGVFKVSVGTQPSATIYSSSSLLESVPINGVSGQTATSLFDPGSFSDASSPKGGFIYGDRVVVTQPNILFTLSESAKLFAFSDAVGSKTASLTDAILTVSNGVAGTTYAVNISFTDDGTDPSAFTLRLEGGSTAIPFDLKFLNTLVATKGQTVTWSGLVNGINTETLYITGIDANTVTESLAGTYKDTITVSITTLP